MKYILTDTFNKRTISRHNSLEAAVKADAKHSRWWKKNFPCSCIPTDIIASERGNVRALTETERDEEMSIRGNLAY